MPNRTKRPHKIIKLPTDIRIQLQILPNPKYFRHIKQSMLYDSEYSKIKLIRK
jgi:hypothetical protein